MFSNLSAAQKLPNNCTGVNKVSTERTLCLQKSLLTKVSLNLVLFEKMEIKAEAEYISYCRLCLEAVSDGDTAVDVSEAIEIWFFDLTQLHLNVGK